jgi:hypothetical protein
VLLGGAGAVVEAVAARSTRRRGTSAGLASVRAPTRWPPSACDELAVTRDAGGGGLDAARALLRACAAPDRRGRLLGAWLDLRTGHLGAARERSPAGAPVLRRDALLGRP